MLGQHSTHIVVLENPCVRSRQRQTRLDGNEPTIDRDRRVEIGNGSQHDRLHASALPHLLRGPRIHHSRLAEFQLAEDLVQQPAFHDVEAATVHETRHKLFGDVRAECRGTSIGVRKGEDGNLPPSLARDADRYPGSTRIEAGGQTHLGTERDRQEHRAPHQRRAQTSAHCARPSASITPLLTASAPCASAWVPAASRENPAPWAWTMKSPRMEPLPAATRRTCATRRVLTSPATSALLDEVMLTFATTTPAQTSPSDSL